MPEGFDELTQVDHCEIRYGRELHVASHPAQDIVSMLGGAQDLVAGASPAARWPGEKVDQVLATAIHESRCWLAADGVHSSTNEREAGRVEARHVRCERYLAIEPGLHIVLIGGHDVGERARHHGADVGHDQMATGKAKVALVLATNQVGIDNFSFTPQVLTVRPGTEVTWINKDDVPHVIVNTQLKFPPSKVLDTDQRFTHTFTQPGTYDYYCSSHPKMTGKIIVA